MKTILIVSQDRIRRETLDQSLRARGFRSLGAVATLAGDTPRRAELILTDEEISPEACPKARFILIVLAKNTRQIIQALLHNYSGVVMSDDGIDGVCSCIRAVESGQSFISPTVKAFLKETGLSVPDQGIIKSLERLSDRERQILKLVGTGSPGYAIADQLHISYRTLANHKTNMCRKLDLESVRNLTGFAISVKDYL